MTASHEFTLRQLVDLANESSAELGNLGGGLLVDYESGARYQFDESTAAFLASARSIVMELARRLRPFATAWGYNSEGWSNFDELFLFIGTANHMESLALDDENKNHLKGEHLHDANGHPQAHSAAEEA